jgi:ribosomal protein S18 acetylase RimI-like enzyme
MIRIRTFIPSDQPAVVALWTSVFSYPAPHNDPAKVIHDKLSVQPELFFVATLNEQVVGTVIGGYDGHRGWIYSLAVNTQHRRCGIGSGLMQQIEAALIASGCPKINLQVLNTNVQVVSFYEKMGYRVEERISMGKVV